MACPTTERIAEYEMGILRAQDAAEIARHLEECTACRYEMAALAKTQQLLEAAPAPVLDADLWPAIAGRLAPARRRVSGWWWKTAAGLGVTLSLAAGLLAFRLQSQQALPVAGAASSSYVADHDFLSIQDPLSDRASLGVILAAQEEGSR